jgi:hypothetical protein
MLRYYSLRRLNLNPRPSGFDKVDAVWKVFSGQLPDQERRDKKHEEEDES